MLDSKTIATRLTNVIINPLIALLFAAGLLLFIYGLAEFLWGMNVGEHGSDEGKQHMLWGVVGMFIMAAAYTIIKLVDTTVGSNVIQ